jgi:S-(hydroxymethyl)glutathione dehydrogenase/alcohol dehydrogenase
MRFKAAVLERVGAPLVVREVTAEELKPSDVLVRNKASGLCHTDLEIIQGQLAWPLPVILGHEGAGIVEAVGRDVTLVKPGDHVVCSWNPTCGHCFYCDRGQPILCEPHNRHNGQGALLDGGSRLALDGKRLNHFSAVSSHAECSIVHETSAIVVPKEIPFDRACLIGCGVMTGVGGAARMARVQAGASVAVIGCGAVGLNAVQGAALERAQTIVAIDIDAGRLAMAKTFGATHTIDARANDLITQVKDLTGGRGADYVLECAGNEKALQTMLEIARPGAEIVILGKTSVNQMVSLRFGSMMGEKRMIRSSYGGARPRRDFPWLARLYLEGRLKLDELITRRITLSEINDGFAAMTRGEAVRTVITF